MDRIRTSRRAQQIRHSASRASTSLQPSAIAVISLLLLLCLPVLAQDTYAVLDAAVLPSCALTCPQLSDAQKVCVPPAAPVTNAATYTSCFCNSNYLAGNLKVGQTTGLCESQCTPADLGRVQAWYNGLCAIPGAATGETPTAPGNGPTVTLGTTLNKANVPASTQPKTWFVYSSVLTRRS
jgi:hypothetical protein